MDPNNHNLVRVTLVKEVNRYIGYINFSKDMPNTNGATLISTGLCLHGAKNKTDLIDFGKARLRQDIYNFNRRIEFKDIEFIELPEKLSGN